MLRLNADAHPSHVRYISYLLNVIYTPMCVKYEYQFWLYEERKAVDCNLGDPVGRRETGDELIPQRGDVGTTTRRGAVLLRPRGRYSDAAFSRARSKRSATASSKSSSTTVRNSASVISLTTMF